MAKIVVHVLGQPVRIPVPRFETPVKMPRQKTKTKTLGFKKGKAKKGALLEQVVDGSMQEQKQKQDQEQLEQQLQQASQKAAKPTRTKKEL